MDMDHGHGDMDMGGQCNMNMLFTWSTKDLCIVFSQWHITGPFSLLMSLIVIVLLTAGYEGVRQATRKYEAAQAQRLNVFSTTTATIGRDNRRAVEQRGKIILAALYAVQVFYSFFIMLLFMTYNGFVMLAVAVGAFAGYLVFGDNQSAAKTVACH
ncbi:copper transpport protein [Aspergillus fumigatus]